MPGLEGQNILLGVSGGIAAYKTPELVRQLRAAGAAVQVVMTDNAHQFVTATSLQAVSGQAPRSSLWDSAAEAAMGHIELARWAHRILIAPATASCMARLAAGMADDLLTTLCLASPAPLHLAPAMNQAMWQHPATQANCALLRSRGAHLEGPGVGDQACGDVGPGRMLEPEALVRALTDAVNGAEDSGVTGLLAGLRVLVTAGPTREALDPVRFISNHSSGKQGYAIAAAAREAGAEVTLVSGPVDLAPPAGVRTLAVTSALDMYETVMAAAPQQDVVIGVAAVADYRPISAAEHKLKKVEGSESHGMALELVQNPDIIAAVAALPDGPFTVGFAAETEHALEHARAKRLRKGLDLIAVNDVSRTDIGFNSDSNAVTLISASGERTLARAGKQHIARALIREIAALRQPG